jgi:hypothetical protein
MKVLGALVNPKGITNHSYKPNLVLKVVSIHLLILYESGGTHYANQPWKTQQHHSIHQAYHLNGE